jgi:hypothetical protein
MPNDGFTEIAGFSSPMEAYWGYYLVTWLEKPLPDKMRYRRTGCE